MSSDPSKHAASRADKPSHNGQDRSRTHVLLIEDDDQMRAMLAEALREAGYQVTECPDAFHWMEFCNQRHVNDRPITYDLVISDVRMPGINGLEVLEGMHHTQKYTPTILITAFGDEQIHRRAKELGASGVLDKPFATRELLELVEHTCGPARQPSAQTNPPRNGNDGDGSDTNHPDTTA